MYSKVTNNIYLVYLLYFLSFTPHISVFNSSSSSLAYVLVYAVRLWFSFFLWSMSQFLFLPNNLYSLSIGDTASLRIKWNIKSCKGIDWNYSWTLNNTEIRDTNPPHSQKFTYNIAIGPPIQMSWFCLHGFSQPWIIWYRSMYLVEKKKAVCKWTYTVQTHIFQGSTVSIWGDSTCFIAHLVHTRTQWVRSYVPDLQKRKEKLQEAK